eukprot:365811-Chlamydomonas_euryale.AAC.27
MNRSDSDEEDEWLPDPKKTVPEWTKPAALLNALRNQSKHDPDRIFCTKMKTCPLEQVFEVRGANGRSVYVNIGGVCSGGRQVVRFKCRRIPGAGGQSGIVFEGLCFCVGLHRTLQFVSVASNMLAYIVLAVATAG